MYDLCSISLPGKEAERRINLPRWRRSVFVDTVNRSVALIALSEENVKASAATFDHS